MSQAFRNEPAGTAGGNEFIGRVMTRPAFWFFVVMALLFVGAYALRTTPPKHLIAVPWKGVAFFWYLGALFIPLLLMLTVRRLGQARFWLQGFLVSVVLFHLFRQLGSYLARHPYPGPDRLLPAFPLLPREVVMWELFAMTLLLFLALPWLQAFLAEDSTRRMKREMRAAFFWQNLLILAVTASLYMAYRHLTPVVLRQADGIPGGILSILLIMMAAPVVHGICVSAGIYHVRSRRPRALRMEGWMIGLLARLMPVFAVASVLVALGLLIPGLRASWLGNDAHGTWFVWGLLLGLPLSVNAAWWLRRRSAPNGDSLGTKRSAPDLEGLPGPGRSEPDQGLPGPDRSEPEQGAFVSKGAELGESVPSSHRLIVAGLFALPVLAGMLLYPLFSCMRRCGMTPDKLAMVLILAVLLLQSLGYIWAAFRREGDWMDGIRPVNTAVSVLSIVLCFVWHSLAFA